jgi:hypothetical protein
VAWRRRPPLSPVSFVVGGRIPMEKIGQDPSKSSQTPDSYGRVPVCIFPLV